MNNVNRKVTYVIYFYLKYLLKNNFYRYLKNENKQKV